MSSMDDGPYSGGCQCGAVRFSVESFGRSSICHCRMCQKAFGGIGGVLVTAHGLTWTRGEPKIFQSSNRGGARLLRRLRDAADVRRGSSVDVAVCALDDPSVAPPIVQLAPEFRVPWADSLARLAGPARERGRQGRRLLRVYRLLPASRSRHRPLAAERQSAMSKERLYLFDTTLRDGAQTTGVDFSLEDKRLIAKTLDELGIDYIEGGYPGANVTDTEFFREKPQACGRALHGIRHDQACRALDVERSGLPGHPAGAVRRHLPRGQGLGLSRARRARHHQRGEPGGHHAVGRGSGAERPREP